MKKRILILISFVFVMTLALAMLVSCGKTEHTLTFVTNGVGDDVTVTAKEGESISAKLPTLVDTTDWHFGGWYESETFEDAVTLPTSMPDSDKTYYARWYVRLDVEVLLQNEAQDGYDKSDEYSYSVQFNKGSVPKKYNANLADEPFGFHDASASLNHSIDITGRDTAYTLKYDRVEFNLTYYANIEDMNIPSVTERTVFGAVAKGKLFDVDGYRFVGWSTSSSGSAQYFEGDKLQIARNTTLYAVWEKGLTDLFGGNDYIFISSQESKTVYLNRQGIDEKKGTYDATSGVFSFELSKGSVLDGRISANSFYYFMDTVEKVYTDFSGSDATIELKPHGEAIYTDADGKVTNGKYEYNTDTLSFVFVAGGVRLEFGIESVDGVLYFRTVNLSERGYYYTVVSVSGIKFHWIIFADGLGNVVEYYYAADYDIFVDGDRGTYEYDARLDAYWITFLDGTEYAVRFVSDNTGENVGGFDIDGKLVIRDGLQGSYHPIKEDALEPDPSKGADLVLDGFGGGTYKGTAITYEYNTFAQYEMDPYEGDYIYTKYYWITFDYQGKELKLALDYKSHSSYNFYVSVNGDPFREVFAESTNIGDIYGGSFGDMAVTNYDNWGAVFLYLYGEDSYVYVFAYMYSYTYDTFIFSYLDYGFITQDPVNTDLYYFETQDIYFNKVYGQNFYFTYDDEGYVVVQVYTSDSVVYDDGNVKIVLNMFGEAIYTDASGNTKNVNYNVDYVEDPELFDSINAIVTFHTYDTDAFGPHGFANFAVYFDEDGTMSFVYLDGAHFYMDDNLYSSYFAFFGDEAHTAFIAIGLDYGSYIEYVYILKGTWATTDTPDEYTFDIDENVLDKTIEYLNQYGAASAMEVYFHCRIRVDVASENQYATCTVINGSRQSTVIICDAGTLILGDDGNATLQTDDYDLTNVTYSYISSDTSIVVLQTLQRGVIVDIFVTLLDYDEDTETYTSFVVGGDEAGFYYMVDSDGYVIDSQYMIFLGNGEAIYVFGGGYYSWIVDCEPTGEVYLWNRLDYTEYKLTFWNDADTIYDIRYIAVTHVDMQMVAADGSRYYHRAGLYETKSFLGGNYSVAEGGILYGDGYSLNTYIAEDGTVYTGYAYVVDVDDSSYFSGASYTQNNNGEHILMYVLDSNGNRIGGFVFDIIDADTISVRDDYFGTYAEVLNNNVNGNYMYLDGHGNATVHYLDDNGEYALVSGTYAPAPSIDAHALKFTPDSDTGEIGVFIFGLYTLPLDESTKMYVYLIYNAEEKNVYISDTWAVLRFDGYGQALYIDKYGKVTEGAYSFISDSIVEFKDYVYAKSTFFIVNAKVSSFELVTSDFVVIEGVLYAYLGSDTQVKLPDNVVTVANSAFNGKNLTYIDFNNVKTIAAGAFAYMTSLKEIKADNVTDIGAGAFEGCTSLTSVVLLKAVNIYSRAFFGCDALTHVKLAEIKSIGNCAFSHSSSADTMVLDLINATHLADIEINGNAFVALIDGALMIGSTISIKINVKDVDSLNEVVTSNSWPTHIKELAGIYIENDGMAGLKYVSLTAKTAYIFDNGTLRQYNAAGASVYAIYLPEGDAFVVYMRGNDGRYVAISNSITNTSVIVLKDNTLYKTGTAHVFSCGEHTVQLTFSLDAASWKSLIIAAAIDGDEAVAAILGDNGVMRISLSNGRQFDFTVTAAGSCTLTELGEEMVVYSKNREQRFTLIVNSSDQIIDVLKFEYVSGSYNSEADKRWYVYILQSVNITGDKTADIMVYRYGDESAIYTVTYTPAGDSAQATADAKLSGYRFKVEDGVYEAQATFNIDIKTCEVDDIEALTYLVSNWSPAVAIDIASVTKVGFTSIEGERPSGTTEFTVTAKDGTVYSVVITVSTNPAGDSFSAKITVTMIK